MISDKSLQMHHLVSGSSSTAFYTPPMPYRCVVRDVHAVNDVAFSSASATLTFVYGSSSTSIGQVKWAATTVGTDGSYTPNASTGNSVLDAGTIMKITPATKGTIELSISIELDPHARTVKGY